jgi:hypothetical protein
VSQGRAGNGQLLEAPTTPPITRTALAAQLALFRQFVSRLFYQSSVKEPGAAPISTALKLIVVANPRALNWHIKFPQPYNKSLTMLAHVGS